MKKLRRFTVVRAQREAWLRTKLAEGRYVSEIVADAQLHALFARHRPGRPRVALSRDAIRKAIYRVRRQLVAEIHGDSQEALCESYERLMLAYRMAIDQSDVRGAVNACKELNRMLGLHRDKVEVGFDAGALREQLLEMDKVTHG